MAISVQAASEVSGFERRETKEERSAALVKAASSQIVAHQA